MRAKPSKQEAKPPSVIQKQMTNPYVHLKTGKRTFGCLREECRGLAMEDLTDRKWRQLYKSGGAATNMRVTLLLTDTTEMTKLEKNHPEVYVQVQNDQESRTYIECVEGADAVGGNKGQQLRTKQRFVAKKAVVFLKGRNSTGDVGLRKKPMECSYDSLRLQPIQHRLYYKEECDAFTKKVEHKFTFILKPETGSQGQGITFHSSVNSVSRKVPQFFPCHENVSINAVDRFLVQEYIARPLLIHRSKFDVRVYMFVASTQPWIVFYREGYLRRSLHPYNPEAKDRAVYLTNTHYQSMKEGFKLSDHIWTFDRLQDYLTKNGVSGARYVDSILTPYIKRVANFVFQSARTKLKRRKGTFHIFGLDFMIDDRFRVHFIEANGYPGFTWSINYDTRGLVTDIMDLVLELHEAPAAFERMRAGDAYGGFSLIFTEMEELDTGISYDPCFEFYNNEKSFEVLRGALRRFSKYTGYAASAIAQRDVDADDLDDSNGEEARCAKGSKRCKALKALQAKEAHKARVGVDRMFENLDDNIEGSEFIGGSKSLQLETLSKYVAKFACSWNELGLQPQSYRWFEQVECTRAEKFRTPSQWIAKPDEHTGNVGAGFRFIDDQSKLTETLGACATPPIRYVVQRRIADILVVDEATWSLRSYMLIASTQPFFVFYAPGFARSVRYDNVDDGLVVLGEREITLDEYQYFISAQNLAGSRFVQTHVETFMRRTSELIFRAAMNKLINKPKTHHLYELDFVVDSSLRVWYMASNAVPSFAKKVDDPRSSLRKGDLRALVLELADTPQAFAGMRYGDLYGPHFSLIYSEYDEYIRNATYNPCLVFKKKWAMPLSVAKRAAELHDVSGRSSAANERELKKYTLAKWSQCRQKGNAGLTCAQSVRRFFAERRRIFLEKERVSDDERIDALVEEWVDSRIEGFLNPEAANLEGGGGGAAVPDAGVVRKKSVKDVNENEDSSSSSSGDDD